MAAVDSEGNNTLTLAERSTTLRRVVSRNPYAYDLALFAAHHDMTDEQLAAFLDCTVAEMYKLGFMMAPAKDETLTLENPRILGASVKSGARGDRLVDILVEARGYLRLELAA